MRHIILLLLFLLLTGCSKQLINVNMYVADEQTKKMLEDVEVKEFKYKRKKRVVNTNTTNSEGYTLLTFKKKGPHRMPLSYIYTIYKEGYIPDTIMTFTHPFRSTDLPGITIDTIYLNPIE